MGYVRTPTIAGERIVFVCEDDLWVVGTEGGIARRLTTAAGECSLPRLSRDGTRLAFVGRDEGHPELYVMDPEGSPPRRLTYLGSETLHCCGWSRDGRFVYFSSDAGSPFVRETHGFRVDADGGEPVRLELGHAITLDVAQDGATLLGRNAIDPARWKRYRGGTAGHLWVDACGDGAFVRICRELPGNLVWPMWIGGRVFFLSDHEGIGNIYSVAPDGSDLRRHTDERDYYARFPATDGERIVYACGGELVLLDPRTGLVRRVDVRAPSSGAETARRFLEASDFLEMWQPSNDGTALALVSRGRTYTMPLWEEAVTEHGVDDGARRRLVAWLHDDKRVAYVDDASGYERVAVAPVDQSAPPRYVTNDDHGVAQARHERRRPHLRSRVLARRPVARVHLCAEDAHRDRADRRVRDRPHRRRDHAAARGPLSGMGSGGKVPLLHLDARLPSGLRRAAVRAQLPGSVATVSRHAARDVREPVRPRSRTTAQSA
jgi:tricorn protease